MRHRRGRHEQRNQALAEALRHAQDFRALERFRWYPNALAELLPIALEHDLESATARHLASLYGIAPCASDLENWPWQVRIHAMGRFDVLVDDRPLEFGRKTPKKTIALLKCLVAMGPGEVAESRFLWMPCGPTMRRTRRAKHSPLPCIANQMQPGTRDQCG